jgi:hypothetical protein
MTLGDFARNYLNPFYLFARFMWLWAAFVFGFLLQFIPQFEAWSIVGYALAAVCVWVAIKPWGKGMSFNDIQNKLDSLNKH